MKHYLIEGEVWGVKSGFQIPANAVLMSEADVDKLYNPEKYLSNEEKLLIYRQNMPTLTPIEFDIKLNNAGLYDAVQELIKDKFELRIAYNRATFFNRTSPFIDQARIALNLTDEQVDAMWMN